MSLRIILLMLVAVSCFGQGSIIPNRRRNFQPVAGGGGGGGGVAGPPGISVIRTNSATSVSSLSTNITVAGANTGLFFFEDWYHATATPNTPTWNGSATGVTLWTNGVWYSDGHGQFRVYYLTSPAAGTFAAATSWSAAVDEANLFAVVITNWAGTFEVAQTNYNVLSTVLSNIVASAANDLMVCYAQYADSPSTPTGLGVQVIKASANPGSATHQGAIATQTGTASTSTNGISWSGSTRVVGQMAGGLIGF